MDVREYFYEGAPIKKRKRGNHFYLEFIEIRTYKFNKQELTLFLFLFLMYVLET